MPIHPQLVLDLPDGQLDGVLQAELDRICREIIDEYGHGKVAARLGLSDATAVTQQLSQRQYRRIPARWLPVLAQMDRLHRIPRFFARLAGLHLEVGAEMPPEVQAKEALEGLLEFGEPGRQVARKRGLLP